jgi:hypothetical protein
MSRRSAAYVTLPVARRIVDRAVAATLVSSALLGAAPPALAREPASVSQTAAHEVVELDRTTSDQPPSPDAPGFRRKAPTAVQSPSADDGGTSGTATEETDQAQDAGQTGRSSRGDEGQEPSSVDPEASESHGQHRGWAVAARCTRVESRGLCLLPVRPWCIDRLAPSHIATR